VRYRLAPRQGGTGLLSVGVPLEVKFGCPHCGQRIACDADYAGVAVKCPSCTRELRVPGPTPVSRGSRPYSDPWTALESNHRRPTGAEEPVPLPLSVPALLGIPLLLFFIVPLGWGKLCVLVILGVICAALASSKLSQSFTVSRGERWIARIVLAVVIMLINLGVALALVLGGCAFFLRGFQ